jgi:hypothetical protein
MAAINMKDAANPTSRGEFMASTLGPGPRAVQLMILHMD